MTAKACPIVCVLVAAPLGIAQESSSGGMPTAEELRAVVNHYGAGPAGSSITAGGPEIDLTVGGYVQFRYLSTFNADDDQGDSDDFESGFQIQRTRIKMAGTLHDEFDFVLIAAAGPNGDFGVLDAAVGYEIADSGWSVKVGQQKLPFYREWLVSERFIQPVERSNQSAVFSSGYTQAANARYSGDDWRIDVSFSDGIRTINTPYTDAIESDFAVTGRFELVPFGEFKQFADLTSLGNSENGLLLGAAAHYQGDTELIGGVDVSSIFKYTADVSYETADGSLLAAFVGRHAEFADDEEADDFGLLLQGGVFIGERTELVGRYDVLLPDSDAIGDDPLSTVTIGLNHYIHGHAAKFTIDAVWQPDPTGDTTMLLFNETNSGAAQLPSDEPNQFAIRAQFQIIF